MWRLEVHIRTYWVIMVLSLEGVCGRRRTKSFFLAMQPLSIQDWLKFFYPTLCNRVIVWYPVRTSVVWSYAVHNGIMYHATWRQTSTIRLDKNFKANRAMQLCGIEATSLLPFDWVKIRWCRIREWRGLFRTPSTQSRCDWWSSWLDVSLE